eukprot:759374-Hanusia_phi.AAC.5
MSSKRKEKTSWCMGTQQRLGTHPTPRAHERVIGSPGRKAPMLTKRLDDCKHDQGVREFID